MSDAYRKHLKMQHSWLCGEPKEFERLPRKNECDEVVQRLENPWCLLSWKLALRNCCVRRSCGCLFSSRLPTIMLAAGESCVSLSLAAWPRELVVKAGVRDAVA
jgi:hypothetical protein